MYHKWETLQYVTPERVWRDAGYSVRRPSTEDDVYSLAMTSFTVCTSFGNHPIPYTITLLQSGPHGGIFVLRNYCKGHEGPYS